MMRKRREALRLMKNLFVLGDSISIHYGPDLQRMLAGKLGYDRKGSAQIQAALQDLDQAQVEGANGGDSRMVLAYLQAELDTIRRHSNLLLLNCGLHDLRTEPDSLKKQVELAEYQANLRAALRLIRDRAAALQPYWVRTTPVDSARHNRLAIHFRRFAEDVVAYNRAADALMAEFGVPVIDLYGFTRQLGEDVYHDHVHFKEPVRALQAAFIAGHLLAWTEATA